MAPIPYDSIEHVKLFIDLWTIFYGATAAIGVGSQWFGIGNPNTTLRDLLDAWSKAEEAIRKMKDDPALMDYFPVYVEACELHYQKIIEQVDLIKAETASRGVIRKFLEIVHPWAWSAREQLNNLQRFIEDSQTTSLRACILAAKGHPPMTQTQQLAMLREMAVGRGMIDAPGPGHHARGPAHHGPLGAAQRAYHAPGGPPAASMLPLHGLPTPTPMQMNSQE
ncbi:hypothetical protein EXIGLDRAFT_706863 [Exidia glandulosa HHB12029]|uniref:Uncharacterized protein n=1 Tax=Exidia glandulosa HHB12029 TaxID=1314781 RepID=A0A165AXZ0_EXIGL|nr:hypothetical protein EXIGLDRAFT_706863 [Exidia glandulosa HHB12029]